MNEMKHDQLLLIIQSWNALLDVKQCLDSRVVSLYVSKTITTTTTDMCARCSINQSTNLYFSGQ